MEGQMNFQIALAAAFLALAPVAATAETQEEQQACMNDAFAVCGDAIPDRGRVAACLAHNISRISSACRMVMQRYQQQDASAATATPMKSMAKATPTKSRAATPSKGPTNIKPKLSASRASAGS
jgi:cell pole-organizing protein PopZ